MVAPLLSEIDYAALAAKIRDYLRAWSAFVIANAMEGLVKA